MIKIFIIIIYAFLASVPTIQYAVKIPKEIAEYCENVSNLIGDFSDIYCKKEHEVNKMIRFLATMLIIFTNKLSVTILPYLPICISFYTALHCNLSP